MAPDASFATLGATTPRIVVRVPAEGDIAGLVVLINAFAAEAGALFVTPIEGPEGTAALRAYISAAARSGNEAVLVAEHEGVIAGVLTATRGIHAARRGVAEVGLGVAAAQRHRGIGGALMTALDGWAPRAGIHRLQLHVVTSNAAAIALYRRHGYETEGVLRASACIAGRLVDQLMMAKIPSRDGAG